MLGKLLKYELKATGRLFIPLYLTILVFAAVNRIFLPTFTVNEDSSFLYNLITMTSMFVYAALMIGLVVMTLLVMIQRFHKNLLGDEGYLMFTLPVQSGAHIFSKLTVSSLWTVASGFVAICSMLILASRTIPIWELLSNLPSALDQLEQFFGASTPLLITEVVVFGLLSLASTILTVYAAIALGHLFNKYKLLISFGMYILLNTASQIFMTLFGFIFMNEGMFGVLNDTVPTASQINLLLVVSILFSGVMTAGFFVLTNYILRKKLNLE